MIASRVTSPAEEGAEVEGTANAVGSVDSIHGCFGRSWVSLHRKKTDVDGTHGGEVGRIKNGDGKMAKGPRDSRRKDKLITGHCILIDIKDRNDEMRGEVYSKIL